MIVRKWLSNVISPYSLVGLLQQVVLTGCNLLVLRWVAPGEMGIWQVMLLIEGYCQVVRVGIINAMNREYPFLLGQGNIGEARRVVQTAQTYTAASAILVTVGLAFASLFHLSNPQWVQALLALSLYAGANLGRGFLEATFRGGADFARLAIVQSVTIILAVTSLFLVRAAGYQGLLARCVVLSVIPLGVCWALRPVRVGWGFDRDKLRQLLVEGFPLFINNYLSSFAQSLPRLFVGLAGGTGLLGLYAPVAALINAGQLLPNVLGTYLLPKLNFEFGKSSSARKVFGISWAVALAVTALMLPLALVGWLLMPGLVEHWLPAYRTALPALQWATVAAGISGLKLVGLLFSTLKAWRYMFQNMIFVLVSNALLPALAIFLLPNRVLAAVAAAQALAIVLQVIYAQFCLRRAVDAHTGHGAGFSLAPTP